MNRRVLIFVVVAVVGIAGVVGFFVERRWREVEAEALITQTDNLSDEIEKALAEPPRAHLDA